MSERKPRAVIDTNLFVSGLIRAGSPPDLVVRAWEQQYFHLVTSDALISEVAAVLQRPRLIERFHAGSVRATAILAALANAERAVPRAPLPVEVRDPKDNQVLACALAGRADYIVTGDADLLVLNGTAVLGRLSIVTPVMFIAVLADTVPHE